MGAKVLQFATFVVFLFIVVVSLEDSLVYVNSSTVEQSERDKRFANEISCIEYEVCGECMSVQQGCRWCADPYLNKQPRCNSYESLIAAGCSQEFIQSAENELFNVVEDKPLQDMTSDNRDTVIQIQPQKIQLSLKPGKVKTFQFTYRPARNYPLDIYYLMDLTWSMKDDKETLVSLRNDLPVMLKNLTDNFRLGFGTFAEKPVMPFISMNERRRANPCTMEEEACEPTYSFHHRLSLTNQVNDFVEHVNRSTVTANLDNAEAQLDALMQVLTCVERIGWSEKSRKIVIVLTDGLLHTAGDGILGGAIHRNDEKCHLDSNGYYTAAETLDYPSLAQIYRLLEFYKVNVIFAVTEQVKEYYDSLQKVLDEFTYIAKLEEDSSNILKLVKKGYEDIVSEVNFEDDSGNGPLKITYSTDCGIPGGRLVKTTTCKDVEFGMTVTFEVRISLEYCPEYIKLNQTIKISETHLGQDFLTLDVDMQCGCTCDVSAEMRALQTACNRHSHLVCGVCQCHKGWSGPDCSCAVGDEEASASLMSQCWNPNVNNSRICSGRGDCDCGKCKCDDNFIGKFCQCPNCGINQINGLICGGTEQGQCSCGKCKCNPGWSGDTCQCQADSSTCMAPGAIHTCSGRGKCNCGACDCIKSPSGKVMYSGRYCEMCQSCENSLCSYAEVTVICHFDEDCSDVYINVLTNQTFQFVQNLNETAETSEPRCVLRREENGKWCEYQYTYSMTDANTVEVTLHMQRCTNTKATLFLSYGPMIIGCIIAIGVVAILIVKCYHIRADSKAYAKFQKEAALSILIAQETQQNPLYVSPITEFMLPDSFPRDKED